VQGSELGNRTDLWVTKVARLRTALGAAARSRGGPQAASLGRLTCAWAGLQWALALAQRMLTLCGRPGVLRACEIATGLGADTAPRQPAPGAFCVPFLNRRWDSDHLTVGRLVAREALATVTALQGARR
jgi:hypothetical protein